MGLMRGRWGPPAVVHTPRWMRIRYDRSTRSSISGPICAKSLLRRRLTCEVEREHFLKEFQDITDSVIRPTMETAIERLRNDGGGGVIEEHHLDVLHKPRVTLWMSMQGEVANPRQDLNPFLQLDADATNRRINVWEGDMVENQGTSRAIFHGLFSRSRQNPLWTESLASCDERALTVWPKEDLVGRTGSYACWPSRDD